jgi:hypothetical protein
LGFSKCWKSLFVGILLVLDLLLFQELELLLDSEVNLGIQGVDCSPET